MTTFVSPASAPCPKCDQRGNMQYEWKPDLLPERERLRCYRCGWDTGWIRHGVITCRIADAEAVTPLAGMAA